MAVAFKTHIDYLSQRVLRVIPHQESPVRAWGHLPAVITTAEKEGLQGSNVHNNTSVNYCSVINSK